MSYQRVIPRDLFNESKLLKCLGRLALLVHDCCVPPGLTVDATGDEFKIDQRQDDGGLYVASGLHFKVKQLHLVLYVVYNSKSPYPLLCEADTETIDVFDDEGALTTEFKRYVGLSAVAAAATS